MDDSPMRLVRCPSCRLQFETKEAEAVCTVCGKTVVDEQSRESFEDETPEKSPTRKLGIIPPRK